MTSYVHHPLGEPVEAIGGSYLLVKEDRVDFEGRQVLYVVGHAAFDSTCCGVGGCGYAAVQGFVLRYRGETNAEGLDVTEVEPIEDDRRREALRKILLESEAVTEVTFR